ncbi:thioredoxin domain-containing protein 3 homolog isoform X3 [Clytia hemisphaerica]|uniref:thioredoxin domain-containing protein 3 homolog isoform X3 n=1 Tax=Clytia hemisphaerica TaxID=252671 RepID=UPI0034D5E7EA
MVLKKGDHKKELQADVKTDEEWQKMLDTQGLMVVDVYAAWCGPCTAIVNTFRRIKNETGDDLLHFAAAETDGIQELESYRGKSEPTFLFYGDGKLINVIRGCNGPVLNNYILTQLKKEHDILDGKAERTVFVDKALGGYHEDEKQDEESEVIEEDEELARKMSRKIGKLPPLDNEVQIPKQVAVALIKPDAVQAGLVDSIIEEIKANGLEILKQEEKVLSKEEAAEFYKQHEGSDHFEQLIEFMSSGPCMTLVVSKPGDDTGEDLLPEFRALIGPLDVNMAKEEAPESLRAKYGTDSIQNAVHSCDSSESAARELAFFFPDFNVPMVERMQKKKRLQRTLALIRPNALKKRRDSILKTIEDSGFLIAMQKEVHLERAQVEELYAEHKDQDYFESLVTNMTCGPSLALCLAREDAVQTWRDMLGPKELVMPPSSQSERGEDQDGEDPPAPENQPSDLSLRKRFADPEDEINPLHGADTEEQVQREMNLFFPMETTVAVIKPDAYEKENERELIMSKIKEAGFKISAHKEVTLTKDLASMFYKEHEGKDFFSSLTDFMASGPTQFLILSREDAVAGFRSLMGPTAPEQAKIADPNSLRAQFGTDEMKNAVHGCSSMYKALNVINEFFPDLQVNEQGIIVDPEAGADKKAKEGEVNANDQKEVANGDVKVEEGKTEETPAESNGDAPKESSEEPAAEDKKEDEPAKTEESSEPEKSEETAAPEDVKVEAAAETPAEPTTEEPAAAAETTEDKKEETTEQPATENTDDAEKKDSPSTVWDPAPGDEVTTLESKHILEEGQQEVSKTIDDKTDTAEESPNTDQQPIVGEGVDQSSPEATSNEVQPLESLEETKEGNSDQSKETEVGEAPTEEGGEPSNTTEVKDPTPTLEKEPSQISASKTAIDTEVVREATITTATEENSNPEDTSREPTMGDSATESSSKPTTPVPTSTEDSATTENETSRETTVDKLDTEKTAEKSDSTTSPPT